MTVETDRARGVGWDMKMKGVITIYLTMVFLLVAAVIFTAAESARVQASRMLTETAADSAMESVLAGYQKELYDIYNLFFFDGAFGGVSVSQEGMAGRLEEYMDYILHPDRDSWLRNTDFYQMTVKNISVDKIALATDDSGGVFRSQAVGYMRASIGTELIDSLTKDYEWAVNNLTESSEYSSMEQETEGTLASLESEKAKADEENADGAAAAREQKNPAAEVDSLRSMGILELMYEDTSQISQKSIDVAELPSHRELSRGNGLDEYEEGAVSNILFQSYLMEKFAHAASKDKQTEGNLQYQLEYLLIGEEHDVDNLKGVIHRLLLIREGANFAYLLTDAGKVAEAYSAAMLLVGYTCLPPLIEATKYAILLAWAYAESVIDVRVLLAGEKVAPVKTAGSWKTSLANLTKLYSSQPEELGDSSGVDYEGYLRMLLLTASQPEVSMRALDLIELQLQYCTQNRNLKMDHMAVMLQAAVEVETDSVFLSLPFMKGYAATDSKSMKITRDYGYGRWPL